MRLLHGWWNNCQRLCVNAWRLKPRSNTAERLKHFSPCRASSGSQQFPWTKISDADIQAATKLRDALKPWLIDNTIRVYPRRKLKTGASKTTTHFWKSDHDPLLAGIIHADIAPGQWRGRMEPAGNLSAGPAETERRAGGRRVGSAGGRFRRTRNFHRRLHQSARAE